MFAPPILGGSFFESWFKIGGAYANRLPTTLSSLQKSSDLSTFPGFQNRLLFLPAQPRLHRIILRARI